MWLLQRIPPYLTVQYTMTPRRRIPDMQTTVPATSVHVYERWKTKIAAGPVVNSSRRDEKRRCPAFSPLCRFADLPHGVFDPAYWTIRRSRPHRRLKQETVQESKKLRDDQAAFRRGRSCTEQNLHSTQYHQRVH